MKLGKKGKHGRGGFFFAVMALAILSLVLLTVQVWVKTFEQADYRASQKFKGEAMRTILATVSDDPLSQFAKASSFYATHKLVNYTSDINTPLAQDIPSTDPRNPNTGRVNVTVFELMHAGASTPNAGYPILYTSQENKSYTIRAWQGKIATAASMMGFDINFSGIKNFSFRQINPWTAGVHFEFDMNITDKDGTMHQNKTMKADANFSISGFLDPSITRNDMVHRGVARELATEKQIFKLEAYNETSDVAPWAVDGAGPEGYGWFFGPVTEDYPDSGLVNTSNLKQYVLVHEYDDFLPSYADSYGAVVVTTQPIVISATVFIGGCTYTQDTQTECLNCMRRTTLQGIQPGCPAGTDWDVYPNNNPSDVPVIVASGYFSANYSNVMEVVKLQNGVPVVEKHLLIDNRYENPSEKMLDGYHRIWDITKIRDMAICGFYVKGIGPSFFQRMLANSQNIRNNDLGIESFVVGQWAGGASDKPSDVKSRLDWEFYSAGFSGTIARVKGMMGCKSKGMCTIGNTNATDIGVGKFRLSENATARYFLNGIACPAGGLAAPCD